MKRFLLSLSFIICHLSFSPAGAQTPAFPGAEGHGRYVTGGREGVVRHVTNLNDSGTGSFRSAVQGSTNKIVVFDVGGVIALKSDVNIGANTTIMGQTAPAPGITLRYYTVQPNGNNIIIRFIRFRRGQEKNVNDGADAIWARNKTGIILDHCSMSWSIDEVASFYDNNNFTMQWCTIGESLVHSGHKKGPHGYGGIWGGKLASFHHNLILHVANRSPRFNGARYNWAGYTGNQRYSEYNWQNTLQAENVDFRNCVIYNTNGCYGGPGGGQINMVGNYYKSGPGHNIDRLTTVSLAGSGNAGNDKTFWDMTSRYYLDGNVIDGNNAGWEKMRYDSGIPSSAGVYYTHDPNHYYGSALSYTKIGGVDCLPIRLDAEAPTDAVTTHTAAAAFDVVTTYAGASLHQDDVDARYMTETRNGTCTYKGSATSYVKTESGKDVTYSCTPEWGRIDLVSDVNGYTEANFGTGSRPADFDTDKDGMPNAWETANGLDPTKDDSKLYTIDGQKMYTNIEVYCNSLVQSIMLAGNGDAIETVPDYYPAYYNEQGELVSAVNASVESAVALPSAPSSVPFSYWCNMQGQRIDANTRGLVIETTVSPDGTRRSRTILRK
ncbi:MAG: pectate lyase [Prevotella sp.]|nr:pectate lyase [Prevotella sp.]